MEVPIRLRPTDRATGSVAGFLIPSGDPQVWAVELQFLQSSGEEPSLFVLPTSAGDRTPSAAFVPTSTGAKLSPRCIPYTMIADRIYIPADGRLDPPFGDAQLRDALPGERLLLHPTLGLVGFSASDARRLSEFFAAPEVRRGGWAGAKAGVSFGRLSSVEPFPPPDVDALIRKESDDIGRDSPSELQPPSTVGGLVGKGVSAGLAAAGKGLGAVERFVQGLKSFFGGTAKPATARGGGKGPLKSVREWFERKAVDFAAIQQRRNQAVSKLVDMLKSNPDRGLRYALPINGRGGRGVATPGDRLVSRDVSFSLSRLFGGSGPVDSWELDYELQRKLDEEYRRIARREAELGRYRRAAYIYAQLLADEAASAAVLKEGRHFHEAAVIYERRLNNPAEAADCYERAGAIDKAVELHHARGDHVAAGDLYSRVGRTAEAVECYRFAVAQLVAQEDRLKAADLLEEKLHAPQEALDVLESAWPNHWSAAACGRRLLAVAGRIGDDERSRRFLATIEDSATVSAGSRGELLVEAFESHPSEAVRGDASRRSWKLLGREIAGRPDDRSLLRLLPRLAPGDRLLVRDANHFPDQKKLTRFPVGRLLREWRLPFPINQSWCSVVANEAGWFALAANDSGVRAHLLRGDWNGEMQQCDLGMTFHTPRSATLAVTGSSELLLLLKCTAKPAHLIQTSAFAEPPQPIRYLDADKPFLCYGVCADELGRAWVLTGSHLHRYNARFHFTRSYRVERLEPLCETPKMAAVGDALFVADEGSLFVQRGSQGGLAPFPPVVSLAASATLAGPMAALAFDQGFAFGQAGQPLSEFHVVSTADTVMEPIVGFSRDGRLVAAGDGRAVVYEWTEQRAVKSADIRIGAGDVAFVTGTASPSEIALFMADGAVRVHSMGS